MKKMIKKRRWWLLVIIVIVGGVGFALFYDDGSVSSFLDEEGKAEFIDIYNEAMTYLPQPVEEKQISTTFGEVKVYKFGEESTSDTAPLLLLPGKSASTPMWESNLADLIEDRTVYTIDLLGEPGKSVETVRIENVQDQAVWLKELIIALDEPHIHLLGLSFGGWSAVNLMVHEDIPQITSITLVDPVYVFDTIPLKMVLLSIPASVPIVPQSIRDRMLSYISGGAEIEEDELIAQLIETGMRTFKSKLPMPQKIKEDQLMEVDVPVLAVLAGKSTMHDPVKATAAAEETLSHENSKFVVFEEASHAINGEYPEELADAIHEFIMSIE